MTAEARVETQDAARRLVELCRRLDQKGGDDPRHKPDVRWGETEGAIDFGWARCTVVARPEALELRAEAADADALAQICELISRHLEHDTAGLAVQWRQDGAPVPRLPHGGRDAMRAFHRRMRPAEEHR